MTRKPKTPIGPEFNPGGARWCEEHGQLECSKQRTKGRGQCHKWAIRGTDACNLHVGMRRELAKARGAAKISAWSAFGDAAQAVDHKMAVIGVLHMSWLRLHAYSELLRQQVAKEGGLPEPGAVETGDGVISGEVVSTSGLIGFRYGAAGKDGIVYAQSEEVRALVDLEAAERDRVVKYAKIAHDMGISDRLTSMYEKWGDVVATRVTLILDSLQLTPEQQRRVPELITAHLSQIEIGPGDTTP